MVVDRITAAKAELVAVARRVSWPVAMNIFTVLVEIGMLVWVLYGLTPSHYCGAQIGAAKMQGQIAPVQDCTAIILAIIDVHRYAVIGLLVAVVSSHLLTVVSIFKAHLRVELPGGGGMSMGGDQGSDPPPNGGGGG